MTNRFGSGVGLPDGAMANGNSGCAIATAGSDMGSFHVPENVSRGTWSGILYLFVNMSNLQHLAASRHLRIRVLYPRAMRARRQQP